MLYEDLKWRGFIKDTTNPELFKQLVDTNMTVYIGFDPTGASLHLGHLVPINMLCHLAKAGHKVIALVGGGTALIGDPRGNGERPILSLADCKANQEKIRKQLARFFDVDHNIIANNYDWISEISVIDFLRDYGKHFTVSYMLNKEIIASRLAEGISYTEFSYMVLQSLDFLQLHHRYGCQVQLGGSDQWGNITAGVELLRRNGIEGVGAVLPLVTTASGAKFGKSLGNALYLDKELTSPYHIYQYFINTADQDLDTYLKLLTFLTREQIEEVEALHYQAPEKRHGQKVLAFELTSLLHGQEEAELAQKMSDVLFSGDIKALTADQLAICFAGVPSATFSGDLVSALVALDPKLSKRAARELVTSKAVYVNGQLIEDPFFTVDQSIAIESKIIIIRRGKKNFFALKF